MKLETKLSELRNYIDKWGEDVRKELGLPTQPQSTIGISFMPSMALPMLPSAPAVAPGMYLSTDGRVWVEVTNQTTAHQVVMHIHASADPTHEELVNLITDTMSPNIFHQLFRLQTSSFTSPLSIKE